jgi:hypothetical protein
MYAILLTYGKFTAHHGKISAVKLKTSWKFGKKKVLKVISLTSADSLACWDGDGPTENVCFMSMS